MAYTYDAVGNRSNMLFAVSPDAYEPMLTNVYAYDEMDRLTNVLVGAGSSRVGASYTFTPAGFLTNRLYSNGVRTQYAYDSLGRLTGLIHAKEAGLRHSNGATRRAVAQQ